MQKLINKLFPLDEEDVESDDEQCKFETSFKPMTDDNTGEVIAVLMVNTCLSCGESYVEEIFTNGNVDIEMMARDLGYREEN